MTWRPAKSLVALESAIKAEYPHRTTRDGFIGDDAHARTQSDHNPNAHGVVCADDVMADGIIDLNKFAEALRTHKDFRLNYVIWNRHITGAQHNWQWAPYTGKDPHTGHVHVSVKQVEADYDDGRSWNLGTAATHAKPHPSIHTIAQEVINGKWGNGDTRIHRLRAAGYDPVAIQHEVNRLLRNR